MTREASGCESGAYRLHRARRHFRVDRQRIPVLLDPIVESDGVSLPSYHIIARRVTRMRSQIWVPSHHLLRSCPSVSKLLHSVLVPWFHDRWRFSSPGLGSSKSAWQLGSRCDPQRNSRSNPPKSEDLLLRDSTVNPCFCCLDRKHYPSPQVISA